MRWSDSANFPSVSVPRNATRLVLAASAAERRQLFGVGSLLDTASMRPASSGARSSCQRLSSASRASAQRSAFNIEATSAPFFAGFSAGAFEASVFDGETAAFVAGFSAGAFASTVFDGAASDEAEPSSNPTSCAVSSRGVWSDIPIAPFVAEMPELDVKRMLPRRCDTSAIGRTLRFATHAFPSCFGDSSTATSHSRSSGGRTVTRKSRPPARSGSSALLVLTYLSSGSTCPTAAPFESTSKTALEMIARRSAMGGRNLRQPNRRRSSTYVPTLASTLASMGFA